MIKKTGYLFFFFIVLVSPIVAFAHGNNYLEFNPDYFKTKPLNVSTAGVLYQVFIPANEFLGGADFWFDNAGNSGTASFELRDKNNNFITSRNVTIPHINPIPGGQRIHVDWNSQIPVVGNDKYRIRISSSLPQLQIYYSSRINFLGHNEPHLSDYLNGVSEINGEEREFSFKYALYETTESSAPIISNVAWTVVSQDQMKISFNANEPIDFKIDYGILGQGYAQYIDFTGGYTFCTEGVSLCELIIDVLPNSSYQYTLTIKDSWGNQSQTAGTFDSGESQVLVPTTVPTTVITPTPTLSPTTQPSTLPPASPLPSVDPTLPVISNFRIVDLTDTTVSLAWTTNRSATSHLLISTPYLITVTDTSDSTLELEHLLGIYSLGPNVSYLATVTSIDSDSHSVRASLSFTTLRPVILPSNSPPPPPPPPPIQNPSASVTDGGNVEWVMPTGGEPKDGYRVDIFDKEGNLVRTINLPSGTHNVSAGDLGEGEYTAVVYTNNDGVFEKVSQIVQPTRVQDPPFLKRLLAFWWALIPLSGGLGYMFWRNRANTSSQIPQQPVV